MVLILLYFTEFVYNVVLKQLLDLPRFQNLLLIVCDHINTIYAIIQRVFGQNLWMHSINAFKQTSVKVRNNRIGFFMD